MSDTLGTIGQLGEGGGYGFGGAQDPYLQQLLRRQAMAAALARQGGQAAQQPMTHPLQVLGSIAQQGVGAWQQSRAERDYLDYSKDANARRAAMLAEALREPEQMGQAQPNPNAVSPQPAAPQSNAMPANYGPTQAKAAYEYFAGQGFTPQQAAAMTANIKHESNFNPTISHDGGIGYGLLGWNGPRLAAMQAKYGKTPTFEQQLEFMRDEVRTGGDAGMGKWGAVKSDDAGALAADLSSLGVRPRDVETNRRVRAATAQQLYQQFAGTPVEANVSTATTSPGAPPSAPTADARTRLAGQADRLMRAAILSGDPQMMRQAAALAGVARAQPEAPNWSTTNVGGNVIAYNPRNPNERMTMGASEAHTPLPENVEAQRMRLNPPTPAGYTLAPGAQRYGPGGVREAENTNDPTTTRVQMTNDQRGQTSFDTERGKQLAATVDEWNASRRKAGETMTSLANFERANRAFTTGAGANARLSVGKWAQMAGMPESMLAGMGLDKNAIASAEEMRAISSRMLTDMIGKGGFPAQNFSNADREALERAMAQITTTPDGNARIISMMRSAAQRQIEIGQAWADWRRQHGTTPQSVERFQEERMPQITERNILAPVAVKDPTEAAKLPPGTRFIDPNGVERTVPGATQ